VTGVVRANVVAALAGGLLFTSAYAHPIPRASDLHASRFATTVVDARALDGAYETVVRLEDGTLATFASAESWQRFQTQPTYVSVKHIRDESRSILKSRRYKADITALYIR